MTRPSRLVSQFVQQQEISDEFEWEWLDFGGRQQI